MATLAEALFTKTQQKLLALLFGRPDKTFYLNEIVRMAGVGKGTVARELEKMLAAGILTVQRIGNQNHYQANAQCPIYEELLGIVRKSFGVVDVLKSALASLDRHIDIAFVFGSFAKGNVTASSDVDLMVIGDDYLTYADLMSALAEAEALLDRKINPTFYGAAEFKLRWQDENAFVTRVMEQPKLWIKGDKDVIGKS